MNAGRFIRQAHRWVSLGFAVAVIINFFAWRDGQSPTGWVTALALVPLAALVFSGLYLFMQPYLRKSP